MAYIYLINLHHKIDEKIEALSYDSSGPDAVKDGLNYRKGQLSALQEFKTFLTDRLNEKLPRRLRKQLKQQ